MSVSNTMTNLFAGDSEAVGTNIKNFFLTISGIMEKGLIDLLDKTILEWFLKAIGVSAKDPISLLLITPVLYTTISSLVHSIADPLLKPLSFATGGKIEQPTLALIGDSSRLGGRNREWIFNDSQLKATVQMASSTSNSALIAKLDRLEKLLASQELKTTLRGSDIDLALRRCNILQSKRVK